MLGRQMVRMLGITALAFLASMQLLAQSTSTLSGTVRDPSGAVVVGATVRVVNQESKDERKTVTTREGVFSVPALHAGTYSLTASAKGFATYTVKDIALSSLDNKSVDLVLPLETVSASVVVSATVSGSIVEEDSGAKSETVTSDQLQNITMSSRNAAEVVKLMSGATLTANGGLNRAATTSLIGMNTFTPAGTAAGLGGTMINGQGVDLTMDGSHDFDPGSPGANTPVNPNMDMISELKVLSSSFSAEYEHGPVVVNAETKGGGSQYHGQVHFYVQHNSLNAIDSTFKIYKQTPGDTHQYYPGGQISGPVPSIFGFNKKKDKLFFFDGLELYRQHLAPGLDQAVVPTEDMYNGNFDPNAASNQNLRFVGNLNPYVDTGGNYHNVPQFNSNGTYAPHRSGCVITGYVLNSACMSSAGLKLLQAYFDVTKVGIVDPATHNGWNYVHNTTTDFNQWQNVARVDWSVSDNTKVYVRINTSRETDNNPNGVWGSTVGSEVIPAPTVDVANNTADDVAAALTHVFSPTLTSESTFAWSKVTMPNKPQDPSKISRSAIGLPATVWGEDAVPSFGNWSSNFPSLGPGGFYVRKPLGMKADKLMPSARTNVTKLIGAHTLKAGGYWELIENSQDPYGNFNGFMSVPQGWGSDVGNSYATMLMGIVGNDYSEAQDTPIIGNRANQFRFFVNDHWKINHRLTIDLGIRFDHMGLYSPTTNTGMAIWDESRYDDSPSALETHTGVYWHGIDSSIPKSGVDERVFFYSPRFGLAYDLFGHGSTILRGGYGRFYSYQKISDQFTGAEMTGYGAATLDCPNASCPVYEMLGADNPYMQPYASHSIPAGIAPGLQQISTLDRHLNNFPYVTTYNLQIDQKMPLKVVLEASYVGNYGQDYQYQADINAIPVGRINMDWVLACDNTTGCSENYDSGTDPNGAYWRPRQNYRAINKSILAGKTQYDGLQVSARRNGGIVFLMTNLTWSKAYSNAAVQNGGSYASLKDYGVGEYWGVSPDSRKLTFNASYTLTEPQLNFNNRIVRGFVNGWQLSGVTQWSSGANMTSSGGINFNYSYGNDTSYDSTTQITTTLAEHGVVSLIGANQATVFPTLTCDPVTSHHEKVPVSQANPFGGVRFFNPSCFAPTTSGLGSTHDVYYPGPAFFNSDLGVMKTVKISDRQNVQFKLQAFNFLNHPLWSFNQNDPYMHLTFNGKQIRDGVVTDPGGELAPSDTNGDQYFGVASLRTGHRTVQLEARYWF